MKADRSANKSTRRTDDVSQQSSAGQNGIAIAPPASGIDFVDNDVTDATPGQQNSFSDPTLSEPTDRTQPDLTGTISTIDSIDEPIVDVAPAVTFGTELGTTKTTLSPSKPLSQADLARGQKLASAPPNKAATTSIAAKGGGEAGAETGDKETPPAAPIQLLMPEPPTDLSPGAKSRLRRTKGATQKAAVATTTMPTAKTSVTGARGAVREPKEETAARAEVSLLVERAKPSPEIEKLCRRIFKAIRDKRPPDEDDLVKAEPDEMAKEASGELNNRIDGDVDRVQKSYDDLTRPPAGKAALKPKPIDKPTKSVATPRLNARGATTDPVPANDVSLNADAAATRARMDQAGMNTEPAKLVKDGPIAKAREAEGQLEEMAQRDPALVLAEQQQALTKSRADMAALEAAAMAALAASRSSTVTTTGTQQDQMVGSEENMRKAISRRAQGIFSKAQSRVSTLLNPLVKTAMDLWDNGRAKLATQFKESLKRVEKWIDKRQSGVVGFFVGLSDDVFGLPDWVTEEYDKAEFKFGNGVCGLIREISAKVNGIILSCELIIDKARTDISDLFNKDLPDELKDWAAKEQAKFDEKLDGLNKRVNAKKNSVTKQLTMRAAETVQEVRQKIHGLREAAKGLIGRIADAIGEFLDDPVRFIINGLLKLVGIEPSAFWSVVAKIKKAVADIADNPIKFINNLVKAVGQGFQKFFDNVKRHLLGGLLGWLFGGITAAGVSIPTEFSVKSVVTFFLQLMGITWSRIRKLLARHVGEENVALVEKAYEVVSDLIAMGPEGIFQMLKEKLDPKAIFDQVLNAAVEFLIEGMIKSVALRVLALFNPVGAIVQAIELIYKVLKWIFRNAARIFSLIETVVNGITDILAGNIGGMATAIEMALAKLIPPVIDFLAGLLNLGGLPDKIKGVIINLQSWVEEKLSLVIGFLAEKAKGLLKTAQDAVEAGKDTVKRGAAAAKAFFFPKKKFTAGNESHTLYFSEKGKNAELMVASRPQTLSNLVRTLAGKPENKTKERQTVVRQIRRLLKQLDGLQDNLQAERKKNFPNDKARNKALSKFQAPIKAKLNAIAPKIAELLVDQEFATQEQPMLVDWPKPKSSDYPVFYIGPKSKKRIPQITLGKAAAGHAASVQAVENKLTTSERDDWVNDNRKIQVFKPHGTKSLPTGKGPLGIQKEWRIASRKRFMLPSQSPGKTEGGKLFNPLLTPFGYRPADEKLDADHVMETQLGGPNRLGNLWPLNDSINRNAGSQLSRMIFTEKDGAPKGMRIPMSVLKKRATDTSKDVHMKIRKTL